jgi:hypothetical protein
MYPSLPLWMTCTHFIIAKKSYISSNLVKKLPYLTPLVDNMDYLHYYLNNFIFAHLKDTD